MDFPAKAEQPAATQPDATGPTAATENPRGRPAVVVGSVLDVPDRCGGFIAHQVVGFSSDGAAILVSLDD